jgi:RNA polymerase sigma factor (sigma-70 family)
VSDDVHAIEVEIPSLRRYARALLRDPGEADDLVQDCLERALRRWRQRRPGEPLRPWLFSIMHNLFVDAVRRRARRGIHVPLDPPGDNAPSLPGVAPTQADGLAWRDLLATLEKMSPEYRSVVLLVGVEDFSYAEAAAIIGCPVGTVMSRLSRGRDQLRRLLDSASRPRLRRVK